MAAIAFNLQISYFFGNYPNRRRIIRSPPMLNFPISRPFVCTFKHLRHPESLKKEYPRQLTYASRVFKNNCMMKFLRVVSLNFLDLFEHLFVDFGWIFRFKFLNPCLFELVLEIAHNLGINV